MMAQTDRNPATITDNKGTVFETAFTYNVGLPIMWVTI